MSAHDARPLALRAGQLGRPAIIVPITGETSEAALDAAAATIGSPADLVEWRADGLDDLTPVTLTTTVRALGDTLEVPLLLTVRTRTEGGSADIDDETYAELVLTGIRSGAIAYVDVEFRREPHTVAALVDAAHTAGVGIVLSAHDFAATPPPAELRELFEAMCSVAPDVVKVAVMPADARDVLRMLETTLDVRDTHPDQALISIAMGPLGVVSRIAATTYGSVASFATVGQASAPGQIDAETLRNLLDAISDA
ncbi:MAG TPA: type I 3-dehydroquinate dehydratase [Terrimesophilobacter sp.]|nr:type I 3-dehydroquinate dehydratase [Terrimesophilobacter sp.]